MTSNSAAAPAATSYRVYKRRWFLLISAALLNLTNAFNFFTFAPIATYSAQFYNVSAADVDWFGQAFFIAGREILDREKLVWPRGFDVII